MAPSKREVEEIVSALLTLNAGLDRVRRQRKGARTLSLLQVIADHRGIRPSEIADLQQVHPLLVARQIRELGEQEYVRVGEYLPIGDCSR